jgi:hypothetical protein
MSKPGKSHSSKPKLTTASKDRSSARPAAVSPRAYMEFATFAGKFSRVKKPVRFEGTMWRL